MFNSFCIISCKVTNLFLFYTKNKIQLSAKLRQKFKTDKLNHKKVDKS